MFTLAIQRRDAPTDSMRAGGKGIFKFEITEETAVEIRDQLNAVKSFDMEMTGGGAEIRVLVPYFIRFRDANLTEHYFALDTIRYATLREET